MPRVLLRAEPIFKVARDDVQVVALRVPQLTCVGEQGSNGRLYGSNSVVKENCAFITEPLADLSQQLYNFCRVVGIVFRLPQARPGPKLGEELFTN